MLRLLLHPSRNSAIDGHHILQVQNRVTLLKVMSSETSRRERLLSHVGIVLEVNGVVPRGQRDDLQNR